MEELLQGDCLQLVVAAEADVQNFLSTIECELVRLSTW